MIGTCHSIQDLVRDLRSSLVFCERVGIVEAVVNGGFFGGSHGDC